MCLRYGMRRKMNCHRDKEHYGRTDKTAGNMSAPKRTNRRMEKYYIIKIFTKYLLKSKPRMMKTNVFWGVTPLSLIIWTRQSFIEIYCLYLQEYSIFRIYDGAFISSETTANVCTFTRLGTQRTLLLIVTALWPWNWQYRWDGIWLCPRKIGIHAKLCTQHTEVTDNLWNPQAQQGVILKWMSGTGPHALCKC